jgi:hypothetical protein
VHITRHRFPFNSKSLIGLPVKGLSKDVCLLNNVVAALHGLKRPKMIVSCKKRVF